MGTDLPPAHLLWELLKEIGFMPDPEVYSEPKPGLSYGFGDWKLMASAVVGARFIPVVLFTGIHTTPRAGTYLEFELPLAVTSREEGLAMLAYQLDKSLQGEAHTYSSSCLWWQTGRMHQDALPWVRDQRERDIEYNSRPRCSAKRAWLRLGLRELSEKLTDCPDDRPVEFDFDGSLLGIRVDGQLIRVPAEGLAWSAPVILLAGNLRALPKRFMTDFVCVEVRKTGFMVGRHIYRK